MDSDDCGTGNLGKGEELSRSVLIWGLDGRLEMCARKWCHHSAKGEDIACDVLIRRSDWKMGMCAEEWYE